LTMLNYALSPSNSHIGPHALIWLPIPSYVPLGVEFMVG
jgi:hypothetical protein